VFWGEEGLVNGIKFSSSWRAANSTECEPVAWERREASRLSDRGERGVRKPGGKPAGKRVLYEGKDSCRTFGGETTH